MTAPETRPSPPTLFAGQFAAWVWGQWEVMTQAEVASVRHRDAEPETVVYGRDQRGRYRGPFKTADVVGVKGVS